MKERITKTKNKIKNAYNKAEDAIYRPFDVTLALRRKKNSGEPFATLNLKGQLSKKVVVFLTLMGALTTLVLTFKIVKLLKKTFD